MKSEREWSKRKTVQAIYRTVESSLAAWRVFSRCFKSRCWREVKKRGGLSKVWSIEGRREKARIEHKLRHNYLQLRV